MLYNYCSNYDYDNDNIYDDLLYMMLPENPMIEMKRKMKREIKIECIKEFKETYI